MLHGMQTKERAMSSLRSSGWLAVGALILAGCPEVEVEAIYDESSETEGDTGQNPGVTDTEINCLASFAVGV